MTDRLLCIVQLPPPTHGVTVVNEIVVASAELHRAFDVDVLPLRFAASIDALGKTSLRKIALGLRVGAELALKLASKRYAAVYMTLTPEGAAFLRDSIYVLIARAFGARRIFHLHSGGIATQIERSIWRRALFEWVFDGASVIQLSPSLRADTIDVVPEDRTRYVANGIGDVSLARRVAGESRVLYLSNMLREKGALVLLDALVTLARRGVHFTATFAGARSDDGCVDEFQAAVAREGLDGKIRYVGPVDVDAKLQLFADHDLVVFPSYRDAFPLVPIEAMRHGLPVIASDTGAVAEIVEHDITGFVVPPRDPIALADRIACLLADPALANRMGKAGRARYLERFTAKQFETQLVKTLREIVSSAPSRRARV